MGSGGAAAAAAAAPLRKEKQRSAAGRWSEVEDGVVPATAKRHVRRAWRCGVNVVLAAFVMVVPPMVILLDARGAGAPAVWISSVNAFRGGQGHGFRR